MAHEMCKHELRPAECSLCLRTDPVLKRRPARTAEQFAADQAKAAEKRHKAEVEKAAARERPRPSVDPVAAKMNLIFADLWCVTCDEPVHRGRCKCDRLNRLHWHNEQLQGWAAGLPTERPRDVRFREGIVLQNLAREVLRAGVGDSTDESGLTFRQAFMAESARNVGNVKGMSGAQASKRAPLPPKEQVLPA